MALANQLLQGQNELVKSAQEQQADALAKMVVADLNRLNCSLFLGAKWKIFDVLREFLTKQDELDRSDALSLPGHSSQT